MKNSFGFFAFANVSVRKFSDAGEQWKKIRSERSFPLFLATAEAGIFRTLRSLPIGKSDLFEEMLNRSDYYFTDTS